jgi:hypothetical protein
MDGDDYTYEDNPTLASRVATAQAHMAQDLAGVDLRAFDQRATVIFAQHEAALEAVAGILANHTAVLSQHTAMLARLVANEGKGA